MSAGAVHGWLLDRAVDEVAGGEDGGEAEDDEGGEELGCGPGAADRDEEPDAEDEEGPVEEVERVGDASEPLDRRVLEGGTEEPDRGGVSEPACGDGEGGKPDEEGPAIDETEEGEGHEGCDAGEDDEAAGGFAGVPGVLGGSGADADEEQRDMGREEGVHGVVEHPSVPVAQPRDDADGEPREGVASGAPEERGHEVELPFEGEAPGRGEDRARGARQELAWNGAVEEGEVGCEMGEGGFAFGLGEDAEGSEVEIVAPGEV